jgi:hypothetical protein
MTTVIRRICLISLLPIALLATRALGDSPTAPASDTALHRAIVGTWLYEKNAGVASVAMFTTYREDGTAIQLIKTKFMFQQASGVWIENRWKILNGVLLLTPVRYRAHSSGAEVDLKEATRQILRVDGLSKKECRACRMIPTSALHTE